MWMNILLLAAAIGFSVEFLRRSVGLPPWSYYALLVVLAAVLYVTNVLLIQWYIQRRAPEFASTEEVIPGTQKWELTAGTGIVPKWASIIGLAAIASLVALAMPFVASLLR
jgi:hypothetical protein